MTGVWLYSLNFLVLARMLFPVHQSLELCDLGHLHLYLNPVIFSYIVLYSLDSCSTWCWWLTKFSNSHGNYQLLNVIPFHFYNQYLLIPPKSVVIRGKGVEPFALIVDFIFWVQYVKEQFIVPTSGFEPEPN